VARRILVALEEWKTIHKPPLSKCTSLMERWRVPGEGWCKSNADGAYRLPDGKGGAGAIFMEVSLLELAIFPRFSMLNE
jgi:hypothetical protein